MPETPCTVQVHITVTCEVNSPLGWLTVVCATSAVPLIPPDQACVSSRVTIVLPPAWRMVTFRTGPTRIWLPLTGVGASAYAAARGSSSRAVTRDTSSFFIIDLLALLG